MGLDVLIKHEEVILQESLENNRDILVNVEDLIALLSNVITSEDKRAGTFYLLSGQVGTSSLKQIKI